MCETLHTDMLAHSRGNLIKVNRHTTRIQPCMCVVYIEIYGIWILINFRRSHDEVLQ